MKRDRQRLQSEAVSAYINVDPEVTGIEALFESQKEAPTRTVYEEVASGDISFAIDSLHTDENGLRAEQRRRSSSKKREIKSPRIEEATAANGARQTANQLASKQAADHGRTGRGGGAAASSTGGGGNGCGASGAGQGCCRVQLRQQLSAQRQSPTSSSSACSWQTPPTSSSSADPSLPPFLQCVLRWNRAAIIRAVSPGGTYMGGFQFSQATWNEAAQLAGMPQLINVPPNRRHQPSRTTWRSHCTTQMVNSPGMIHAVTADVSRRLRGFIVD